MALSKISGTTGIADATITSAKLADFTAAVDLNGVELLLDADADTSISADTDDQIDIKIANADHLKILSSSGDTVFKPMVDAKDIIFQQFDGNKIFCIDDGNFVSVGGNATAAGQIRIYEDTDNGSHYSGFTVGNLTASVAYQLPDADGSSGQALITDGSGVLSFTTLSANTPSSADGQALGSASLEWSDLFLADASVINFGNDQDVTLTHVADTGILLNSTRKIQFGDSASFVHQSADGTLTIDGEAIIDLNASTRVDVSTDLKVGDDINLASDSAAITFGADSEITLTHVADNGLILKHAATGDDKFPTLTLQTGDTDIAANDKLGALNFQAPDEGAGTDAITVCAGIAAISEGDFAADNNATKLSFKCGASEAATEKMSLSSVGILTIADDLVIKDGGTIGSASDVDAIAIGSDGDVTLTQDLELQHDGAILSFGADDDTTLTHTDGTGLTLNSTNKLCFNDASQYIQGASNAILDIAATDEIELTATLIEVVGNATVSGTLGVTGVTTSNAGVVVDNITIDGTEIDLSSGDLLVDVAGDITLDAGGGNVKVAVAGTDILDIANSSSDVIIKPTVDAKDIIFQQADGTSILEINDGAFAKFTAAAVAPEATLTDASTVTINALTQSVSKVTLGGNRTIGLASGGVSGAFISILVIQDGTGSRTVTWNAAYEFAADTAPTLTTTANLGDLFVFRYNGAKWLEVGRNLALTLS